MRPYGNSHSVVPPDKFQDVCRPMTSFVRLVPNKPTKNAITLIRMTTFSLKQEVYEGDPYTDVADQVEPLAYVNYGRVEDFTTLEEMGINVRGAIVLARIMVGPEEIQSGVLVGTVFNRAGDPSTPGWPSSIKGCERLSEDEVEKGGDVPLIPSLSIPGDDGEEIIKSIDWVVANDDWQGDKDDHYKAKQVISTIQNIIGIIEGVEEHDSRAGAE
ncbi:Peptidase M28 [Artemisia annua]|uniref:Peptidase M28 n=1 Tax=Artemisia annua TaxID=35608 RepID=A0A2U1LI07_ARTAN|nr:Peptidase M28 [Artemisia annua]